MSRPDIPESWQRALEAKAEPVAETKPPVSKPKPPRTPIQPSFKLRWGILAFLLPAGALFLAAGCALLFRADFPDWPGAVLFYAMLCGGNGMILSLAIGMEHSHERYAAYCALAGILSVCVVLVPGAAEVYVAFLVLYLLTRAVSLGGLMSMFVFGLGIGVSIVFLAVLNYVLKGAVLVALDSSASHLALALIAACPLAHSLATSALPAERTFFGRLDAMLTGIAASLLGMFVALVLYRTLLAATGLAMELAGKPLTNVIQLGVAAFSMAIGNWFCVRQLFRFAYTAREESPRVLNRKDERKQKIERPDAPDFSIRRSDPVSIAVDSEPDVDEAT